MVGDLDNEGDPSVFQQLIDIIQVEAPSSMIVRWIFLLRALTWIRKANWAGNYGVYPEWLKTTRLEFVGSTPPIADSKACFWEGQFYNTSSVDKAEGDWAQGLNIDLCTTLLGGFIVNSSAVGSGIFFDAAEVEEPGWSMAWLFDDDGRLP